MTKITSLTKAGVEKLIDSKTSVSPSSSRIAKYDSQGCLSTNDPNYSLDCVNKHYLEQKLSELPQGGGGTATGTSVPAAGKIAAYDSGARLRSEPQQAGATTIFPTEVVAFGDLINTAVDSGKRFDEFKRNTTPFRVKVTSADSTTGGRVNLPIPDSTRFPWITRVTGAGGGYEYEMESGYAYHLEMSIYGKAYFRSYNMFEEGTGFWNLLSSTGENWKSDTVIMWRKNGKPNVWIEHNGWQTGPGRIAVLQITQLRNVEI